MLEVFAQILLFKKKLEESSEFVFRKAPWCFFGCGMYMHPYQKMVSIPPSCTLLPHALHFSYCSQAVDANAFGFGQRRYRLKGTGKERASRGEKLWEPGFLKHCIRVDSGCLTRKMKLGEVRIV